MSSSTGDSYTRWFSSDGTINGVLTFGTVFTPTLTGSNYNEIIPNKDWMPYVYVEYEPLWHKKFASFKNQIKDMWK